MINKNQARKMTILAMATAILSLSGVQNQGYSHMPLGQIAPRTIVEESKVPEPVKPREFKWKRTFEKGESLDTIAAEYHTTVKEILELNKVSKESQIKPGTRLTLKNGLAYILQNEDLIDNKDSVEHNRQSILKKTGADIEYLRFSLDINKDAKNKFLKNRLLKLIGLTPGTCATGIESTILAGQYSRMVEGIAKKYDLDTVKFAAVIMQESGFGQWTSSKTGAFGIAGQTVHTYTKRPIIVEENGERKIILITDHINPFVPEQAIERAAQCLRTYQKFYNGDWTLAVTAYNAGPDAVSNAIAKCPKTWAALNNMKKDGTFALQGEKRAKSIDYMLAEGGLSDEAQRYYSYVEKRRDDIHDAKIFPTKADDHSRTYYASR